MGWYTGNRYIHIKDPLRYGRWMTKRVIYCSIGTIWLLATLISFMPVSLDLHKPQRLQQSEELINATSEAGGDDDVDETYVQSLQDRLPVSHYPQCVLDLTPTYAIVSSCISFCFPCIVMLVRPNTILLLSIS